MESIMELVLQLKQMSIEEKLRAMETIWDDLIKNADSIPSPSWHEQVLNERDQPLKMNDETFMDWQTAKKKIQDSVK